MTLPLAATVIVAMATILIVIVKQLKDARYSLILEQCSPRCVMLFVCHVLVMGSLLSRTRLGTLSNHEPPTDRVYETPAVAYYEDVSKMNVGGASDHIYTRAMELSQCPAYASTEESTGRGTREREGHL